MTSETTLKVRYAETDQMGIVYHANYLIWFEVGRTDFLTKLGFDYRDMASEHRINFAVVEANARYKAPARFADEIVVRTSLAHVRNSTLRFHYRLHRASDDLLLTEGHTTHIVVGTDMKRASLPPRYLEALHAAHIPVEP